MLPIKTQNLIPMKSFRLFLIAVFTCSSFISIAQTVPLVSITKVLVDGADYSKIEVEYTLQADATDSVMVHVLHSNDGGVTYNTVNNLSGDFNKPVANGTKTLSYESAVAAAQLEDIKVKVSAVSRFAPSISEMVAQVQTSNMLQVISDLEGTRNYAVNPARMDSIKDYLETDMAASLDVERLGFTYASIEAENLLSNQHGLVDPMKVVVNGAHFDGVPSAPAADDNASGTAGVLEAARILSQYQFEHSIRYLLFDLEELGLRGSIDYVSNDLNSQEVILGAIINEMIAYSDSSANSQQFPTGFNVLFPAAYNQVAADSFRGDFITNVGNTFSAGLMASYHSSAQQYVPILKVVDVEAPGNSQMVQDLRRSDHAPFWDAGYEALMITDGANFRNPNYHEASDSLSTLDLNFMKTVVQANVATLATLAKPINAGSAESSYTAILNVANLPNETSDCISVQANSLATGQTNISIQACEGIQEMDIHVSDLAGRTIAIEQLDRAGEAQLKMEFRALAQTVYIIHGSINGKAFSERILTK